MILKNKIFLFIFIVSIIIFFCHFLVVGSGVWGDGQYYYAHLRSWVIDRNLDFTNELNYFHRPLEITNNGLAGNKYSIGPGLFWLPFFILAHLITLCLNKAGILIDPNGYTQLYQLFTGIGSIFYGISGLFLCFLSVRKCYSSYTAYFSTLVIFLSSNLLFYLVVDPINSHAISFFLSSYIVYLCNDKKNNFNILIGILMGLLITVRNQDLVFLLPLLLLPKENIKKIIIVIMSIVTFIPQLLVWNYIYGSWQNPYLLTGEKFYFTSPKIISVLFSSNNGLFYYSPILVLSLIGLYFLYPKNKYLSIGGIGLFIFQLYIISCWHSWSGGQAYGGRFFISLMPYFIFGLAAFLHKYIKYTKIITISSIVLVLINLTSIINFLIYHP